MLPRFKRLEPTACSLRADARPAAVATCPPTLGNNIASAAFSAQTTPPNVRYKVTQLRAETWPAPSAILPDAALSWIYDLRPIFLSSVFFFLLSCRTLLAGEILSPEMIFSCFFLFSRARETFHSSLFNEKILHLPGHERCREKFPRDWLVRAASSPNVTRRVGTVRLCCASNAESGSGTVRRRPLTRLAA